MNIFNKEYPVTNKKNIKYLVQKENSFLNKHRRPSHPLDFVLERGLYS